MDELYFRLEEKSYTHIMEVQESWVRKKRETKMKPNYMDKTHTGTEHANS